MEPSINDNDNVIIGLTLVLILTLIFGVYASRNTPHQESPKKYTSNYTINTEADLYCKGNYEYVISGGGIFSSSTKIPIYENGIHAKCESIEVK